jgi:tetratricopeptide (TPR) repeat protein
VSYYQASLVVDLIEREHGFPAVLALLRAYKEGLGTAEAFRKAVGVEPEALDRRLKAYVDERFKTALAGVKLPAGGVAAPVGRPSADEGEPAADDFTAQLRRGQRLFAEKKYDEAAPYLERAKALFPEYAEDDSPYWLLAVIHKENGAREKALAELRKLSDANESHHQANLDLAELLEEAGDGTGAAAALERTMFIHPYDASVHARLAALYAGLGEKGKAVREREALVALDPVDRPQALYELALARLEAGDPAGARREVLRALEAAPRFEKAQELLLRLSRERAGSGGTGGGR